MITSWKATIIGSIVELLNSSGEGKHRFNTAALPRLERPRDPELGDLALPCFTLSKTLRQAPQQIAASLAEGLNQLLGERDELSFVDIFQANGPYLNISVKTSALARLVIPHTTANDFDSRKRCADFIDHPTSETSPWVNKRRVMVEYASLNTHKPVHVGHIRNTVLGDSIARLLSWYGLEVLRSFWLGDEGTHVAKCLWLYRKKGLSKEDLGSHPGQGLGEIYAEASNLLNPATYTAVPISGAVVAKINEISPHPDNPKWRVVKVSIDTKAKDDEKESSQYVVVTGASGGVAGDLVPYLKIGSRFRGKPIKTAKRGQVESEGMLLSYDELGLRDSSVTQLAAPELKDMLTSVEGLAILPTQVPVGSDMVELFRFSNTAISNDQAIMETLQRWEGEVSNTLQKLEQGDPETKRLWQETHDWSMDDFRAFCNWLGSSFHYEFFESQDGHEGKQIVIDGLNHGLFVESDGAIGADLSEQKMGFCILIKRDGTANYATRDIALAKRKFEQYGVDHSVYVVDTAQTLHFEQLFYCLETLGIAKQEQSTHVSYARVVTPSGEMSSRKGSVILFSDLKKQLTSQIMQQFLSKYEGDWSIEELEETNYRIALATVRYGMLLQENSSKVVFDLKEWCNRSGNTGPYLLYAYARIASILREGASLDSVNSVDSYDALELINSDAEKQLLLELGRFPEVAEKSAVTFAPSQIATYLFELTKAFSRFYHECPVLTAESDELKVARLKLCEGVQAVLKAGFNLLGIKPVERM